MDRKHIVLTKLPDGFTREELQGAKVEFRTHTHEGIGHLRVHPVLTDHFEIDVECIRQEGDFRVQTIHHQTSHELFLIERLSNPGGALFRLSSYTPSPSDLQNTRAAALPRSGQIDEI